MVRHAVFIVVGRILRMKKLLTWLGEHWVALLLLVGGAAMLALATSPPSQSPTDRTLAYIERCNADIEKLRLATQVKSMDDYLREAE